MAPGKGRPKGIDFIFPVSSPAAWIERINLIENSKAKVSRPRHYKWIITLAYYLEFLSNSPPVHSKCSPSKLINVS